MGLVAAEVRKLTSVRTTWVITVLGLLLVALSVGLFVFEDTFTGPFTGSDEDVGAAIGQIAGNSAIVLVVAVLVMTTEFRHGTIGRTLQLVPSRTRVLVTKTAVGGAYAVLFFVVGLLVVLASVFLSGEEVRFGSEAVQALWQGAAALVLTAVLGIAVGALVRSQVVALTLSLVWVFIVEPLVSGFLPAVGRWLPFQLLNALFVTEEMGAAVPEGAADPVAAPLALTIFFGYVLVVSVAATLLMRYRDV